jgi:hypothetical protein
MENQQRPSDDQKNDNKNKQENQNPTYDEGSKSDPQMTELEGLKDGGKQPHVHKEDKPRNSEGQQNA